MKAFSNTLTHFYREHKVTIAFGLSLFALVFIVATYFLTQDDIKKEVEANRSVLCDFGRLVEVSTISDMDRLKGETRRNFKRRQVLVNRFTEEYRKIDCKGFGFTVSPRNRQNGDNGSNGNNGGDANSSTQKSKPG